ncbi:MAG: hypothetical protein KY475_20130, partial [Planctomycetes bacterium]|nr:hypothetical protein [Planctomycetota bacterium]
MTKQPYEQTFPRGGRLCFFAPAPALAHIGERFDELSDASFCYEAPAEEQERWKRLVRRLESLAERSQGGSAESWPAVNASLHQEFGECFEQARGRVSPFIHEYFDTGQMPMPEYLEWLAYGAEAMWSLNGGTGLDMDAFLARSSRLSQRLLSGNYESEADRRLRAEDPQQYELLTTTMQSLWAAMDDLPPIPSAEDSEPEGAADADRGTAPPPGSLLFSCGDGKVIDDAHISLFHEFLEQQDQLRPAIEKALRTMHGWMCPPHPLSFPGDRVLFPENSDATDVPLQCFRIREVSLQPEN